MLYHLFWLLLLVFSFMLGFAESGAALLIGVVGVAISVHKLFPHDEHRT